MFKWTGPLIILSTLICTSVASHGRRLTSQGVNQPKEATVKQHATETSDRADRKKDTQDIQQPQNRVVEKTSGPRLENSKREKRKSSSRKGKEGKRSKGLWSKGVNTVIQLKGELGGDSTRCHTFNVKMTERLQYEIKCGKKEKVGAIHLTKKDNYTVTRHGQQVTITRFNYLIKKPQTSQFEQNTLKIPYVEEIIHVKKRDNGELAFYLESFSVDEFGRIVQKAFIQAHGLSSSALKISSTR